MLLRESSRQQGRATDVAAVTDAHRDSGLSRGAHLNALVEALLSRNRAAIAAACTAAEGDIGADAVRDALVVACGFNGITRVADATGIPLDPPTAASTEALRRETGIDAFQYHAKSERYGG